MKVTLYRLKYKMPKIIGMIILILVVIYCIHPGRFASHYPYIEDALIEFHLERSTNTELLARESTKPVCAYPHGDGNLLPVNERITVEDLEQISVSNGGAWQPSSCVPRYEVAVVVAYRNRLSQLIVFLHHMHQFLQKQLLKYRIIIVEQYGNNSFNRAKLFNIGYAETMKISPYDCFIFHDVDLIPQNLDNIYACSHSPRHMSSSLNTFRYNLPYMGLFGGVVALSRSQFELVNGFSNVFYGWGGEDDDFQNRIAHKGLKIIRFSPKVASYTMLAHSKDVPNPDRHKYLDSGKERFASDGLNSLNYELIKKEFLPLYTWILVNI